MPRRWRWPPENSCGNFFAASGRRPTRENSHCTRSRRSATDTSPKLRSGSATMSPAVRRGFSEAYGSWKMICRSRRRWRIAFAGRVSSSSPFSRTEPEVGSTSRITDLAVVVLPQPDGPTSDSVSPCPTVNDTPSTAWMAGLAGRSQRRGEV
ncbi:hypothetical protein D9M69_513900 [compost metagenome]